MDRRPVTVVIMALTLCILLARPSAAQESQGVTVSVACVGNSETVTYHFGSSAPEDNSTTLTQELIFDDGLEDGGVGVYTGVLDRDTTVPRPPRLLRW